MRERQRKLKMIKRERVWEKKETAKRKRKK